jgi:hypothetical protein
VGSARLLLTRMNRRVSLSALLLLVLCVVGCSSSPLPTTGLAHPSTAVASSVPALNLAQPDNPLPAPTTYSAVCDLLSSTCATQSGPPGGLPPALARPLKFPTVSPGTPCPTSAGAEVDTGGSGGFGGIALGLGDPVRPLGPFTPHGIATGSSVSMDPSWFGPKTLWYVVPAYQAPVLIRGSRLDGPGPVGFGEQPLVSALIIPPGPTLNELSGGYRTSPGGTYVMRPGCYGVQVDGTSFSYLIVLEIPAPT